MYFGKYTGDQLGSELACQLMQEDANAAQSVLAYLEDCTEGGDGLELVNAILALCTSLQAAEFVAHCRKLYPDEVGDDGITDD